MSRMTDPETHVEPQAIDFNAHIAQMAWAADQLGAALEIEIDPILVRRLARESALDVASGQALGRLLERSGLIVREAQPSTELPLVAADGSWVVLRRDGARLEVRRPREAPRWVTESELAALGPMRTVTAATPLERLTRHATAGARLFELVRLERGEVWIVAIYAIVAGLFTLATPVAVQALFSSVAYGTVLQPIVVLSLLLLVALVFQAVMKALQLRVVELMQRRFFVRTAIDLGSRLPRVSSSARTEGFGPDTVNRFFEVVNVQKAMSVLLTDGIATALQVGLGLLVLAFYHPALLGLGLVLSLGLVAVIALPARTGLGSHDDESHAKYAVAAWLQQLSLPVAPLRSASGLQWVAEKTDALTLTYLRARQTHFRVWFLQAVGVFGLQVLSSVSLLGLGGWLVISRELSLGQLVAAELIVAAVVASLGKAPKLLSATYDLLTAMEKLGHVLELPLDRRPLARSSVSAPARVELPQLQLAPAEKVAVTGAQALHLAPAALAAAPEALAVRPGELFAGTILENIVAGRPGIGEPEVRRALTRLGVLAELEALEAGLSTELAATGAPLDARQALLVTVARATVAPAELVVVEPGLELLPDEELDRCVRALTDADARWTLLALVSSPDAALARACQRTVALEAVS